MPKQRVNVFTGANSAVTAVWFPLLTGASYWQANVEPRIDQPELLDPVLVFIYKLETEVWANAHYILRVSEKEWVIKIIIKWRFYLALHRFIRAYVFLEFNKKPHRYLIGSKTYRGIREIILPLLTCSEVEFQKNSHLMKGTDSAYFDF